MLPMASMGRGIEHCRTGFARIAVRHETKVMSARVGASCAAPQRAVDDKRRAQYVRGNWAPLAGWGSACGKRTLSRATS
jgi:hypothetical protein